jgi:hypothetical protein
VAVSTTKGTSLCNAEVRSRVALRYAFTVSQGDFLTVTTTASPDTFVNVSLEDGANEERFLVFVGQGSKVDGPLRVFLPPGSYEGNLGAGAWASSSVAIGPTPVSASIRGDFTVAGSQLAGQAGKAAKYVVLPSARSCAAHLLLPTITDRKKRVRQVKKVTFFVNGARVEKVRIEVALRPTRKGRPGKVLETAASYEACS